MTLSGYRKLRLFAAPLQGHTEAVWRGEHMRQYGDGLEYVTPFVRVEKGAARPRDMRDITSPANGAADPEPQVIFKDMDELRLLLDALVREGATRVNLNMGCPFPLQTGKGRGAGLLASPQKLDGLVDVMEQYRPLHFSAKMRLGYDDLSQWRAVMERLNSLTLDYVAVHPRTARQKYSGPLALDQFEELLQSTRLPVIFNGEIHTPADIEATVDRWPGISGVMAGRGLLARPSLFAEYLSGQEMTPDERLRRMVAFHDRVLAHYTRVLCGDTQTLSKIKPFWEYAEDEIGHKAFKAIRKATTMARYRAAVDSIQEL